MNKPRMIVAITGASGACYGVKALEKLKAAGFETHLTVSRAGQLTLKDEMGLSLKDLESHCDELHPANNVGATIASGSFQCAGMLVAPCTVRTMAEIANGATASLVTRAADVTLKERRRLVLMVRETPLHLGHLRAMTAVTEMGGIVTIPVPAFYARINTLDEMVEHTVGRTLDLFGIDTDIERWPGLGQGQAPD